MDSPKVRKYGPNGILMEWKSEISPEINEQVVRTAQFLSKNYSEVILEVVPSYHSLLIFLKNDANVDDNIAILRYSNIAILNRSNFEEKRLWQIPTCYSDFFGFDLTQLAEQLQLSKEQIIQLHTESSYRIYGMGFLPGFLYLGGLSEQLHFPRKGKVTPNVPKGSVAIGGKQTGIYPQNSPGGWHVIGRTPIELFDLKKNAPSPFSVGDSIQFVSIDFEEFEEIRSEIDAGNYQLKSVSHD